MKNITINKHSKSHKKALGAYYTPINLSKVICEWALRKPSDYVLEPSFGGCGFLEASVERLKGLGSIDAVSQLFGVDIDPTAFNFLSEKIGKYTNINKHFLYKDFLQVSTADFKPIEFDVVLGNPPYVSLHNMSKVQKESCFELLKKSEFARSTIGRNASLWAFFILHSLSFIKDGGRCAWVLPSSLLHADYAKSVLKVFSNHFSTLKVVKLNERFFQKEDADEVSVILFADGFTREKKQAANIGYSSVHGADELELLCKDISLNSVISDNYKSTLISTNTLLEFEKIITSEVSVSLGSLCKIVIGMVTGDNNSFIIDQNTVKANNLQNEDLKPVVGRFSLLTGLIHTKARHKRAQKENHKAYLVSPCDISLKNTSIRKYLAKVPKINRKNNRTFAKRPLWYYPDDSRYPDAFLTYMIHKSPRMVINISKINCTNSIHRVFFHDSITLHERKAVAISMLSSFSQLSAEIEGRAYGSGVLKLEPSAAKKIKILLTPDLVSNFNSHSVFLDKMISTGLFEEAQRFIDQLIIESLNIPPKTMKLFSSAVETLREERYMGLNKTKIERNESL
ncbi:TPA: N-6 DNA methylase [Citrobacter freundii]|uniref:HsdM family class I SAM-dependent methyltransferase n=1 Tax=Pseudocitrobacter sp. RIT415 TaxID=2202163 RepID=UPI000D393BB2|nr:N-6 DNA methylase [Pseudocitrobacter sp. RIT 415]RAU49098.1 SAM-dependent methyltransferase [Pseudocitrobacter sp. RIT 415]HEE0086716.1 N-6 DNA methylase [Citrobacter freundii]